VISFALTTALVASARADEGAVQAQAPAAQPALPPPPSPPPAAPPQGYGAPPQGYPPGYGPPPGYPPGYGPPPGYPPGYGPPPGYAPPGAHAPPPYAYQQPQSAAELPPDDELGRYEPTGKRRRSVPLLVLGIISTAVGGVFLASGLGATLYCATGEKSICGPAAGMSLIGGAGLGVGVPLIVYGAKKVAPEPTIALGPRWVGAPAGVGWKWQF